MRSIEDSRKRAGDPAPSSGPPEEHRRSIVDGVLYAIAFIGGLTWTGILLGRSPGTPSQDEIAHVLIARQAWYDPHVILDAWGRPVNTLLYVLPSRFGLTGARIGAIAFAAITVVLTTLIARELGVRRVYLVPLLLWFQPWFHDFGHIALTETPFSMVLVIAMYAWLKDRKVLAAVAFGALPLVRWEALALLPVGALIFLLTKRWRLLPVLAAPVVGYLVLGTLFAGDNVTMREYLRMTRGAYGYGTWGHFFGTSAPLIGVPALVAAAVGLPRALRDRRMLVILGIWVTYFALQVFSWRYGKGAGYVEFALPVAPGVAILGAMGVEYVAGLAGRVRPRYLARTVTAAVVAIVAAAVLVAGLQTEGHPIDIEQAAMQDAARWLRAHDPGDVRILSTHAWFQYYYEIPFPRHHRGLIEGGRDLSPGTIMVWDRHYSDRWGYHLDDLKNPINGWDQLATFRKGRAAVFRKL